MGTRGYAEFHRGWLPELHYPALIIDVRFNGGGHVSQLLLEKLARKRLGYDVPRWHAPEAYPRESVMGPLVALTNEYAGSDGDIFSHCFKRMNLGPLIGTRTWGGVIGISPRMELVDGSVTTQPEFSFWFDDVEWGVENYGTEPDVEVYITPQDYRAGRDPQLEAGLETIQRLLKSNPPVLPPFHKRPARNLPKLGKAE
jgi:tricorn protease